MKGDSVILLGLGGKPHSGKSVAAEVLRGSGARIYSISDMICEELGVKRERVSNPRILQDHGHRQREKNPNYWTDKIIAAISTESPDLAVIPNIRMPNEAALVHLVGGHLVRYVRLNGDGSQYVASDRDMNHPLETTLDHFNWDFYITAKGGQRSLIEVQTVALLRYLKESQERENAKEANRVSA